MVLGPLVKAQRAIEHLDADHWEDKCSAQYAKGAASATRLEKAAWGDLAVDFELQVRSLGCEASHWVAVSAEGNTSSFRSLAFGMLARSLGGMTQVLFRHHAGFPFRLWRLLREPSLAAGMLKAPTCMKDTFTLDFLQRYPTPQRLQSNDCRAELLVTSLLARRAICRIECRHASLRRRVKMRVQCRRPPLVDLSASFVLMRQRAIERRGCADRPPKVAKVKRRVRGAFRGGRTGGGGRARAAFSQLLRELGAGGQRTPAERKRHFKEAHRRLRHAEPKQLEVWAQQGAAGKAAHREGERSFGPRLKRRRVVVEEDRRGDTL